MLPGTPEYWSAIPPMGRPLAGRREKASAESITIGLSEPAGSSDHDRLHSVLAEKIAESHEPLWIVLIGHGTYDGREAKFNLRGPDVTDLELSRLADAHQGTGRHH